MTSAPFLLRGLYAVTPNLDDTPLLVEKSRQILQGGAKVLQYRHKTASPDLRLQQALALQALCQQWQVPFIINDHLDLCLAINADGLHIGGTDGDPASYRAQLNAQQILGVSCYGDMPRALAAQTAGADYAAFGGFYPSIVKQYDVTTPASIIGEAKAALRIPVVVIGGMTVTNARPLVALGADMVAAVSSLYAADNAQQAAEAFADLFNKNESV